MARDEVRPGSVRHGAVHSIRGPRGRRHRWVARDEVRPGSVRHGAVHSTGGRGVRLTLGVVRAADEWSRLDMGEPELPTDPRELGELVGMVVARDGQVLRRRPEVLAERQDRHPDRAQVAQGRDQLVPLLAETQDDPGLGRDLRRDCARVAEEPERTRVTAAVPRGLVEALHRLGVVVQDVRPRVEHRLERRRASLEVGDQDLHAAARRVPAHRTDRRRPVRGAAVREVVTIDRRDHDVLEPELAHGPADPLGLLAILPDGRAVRDRAVAAVAGAHVAQDHERRGRVLPALPDVGTARLLADRVEVPLAHPTLEAHVVGAAGGADLEPRRLAPLRDEARRLDHGK